MQRELQEILRCRPIRDPRVNGVKDWYRMVVVGLLPAKTLCGTRSSWPGPSSARTSSSVWRSVPAGKKWDIGECARERERKERVCERESVCV